MPIRRRLFASLVIAATMLPALSAQEAEKPSTKRRDRALRLVNLKTSEVSLRRVLRRLGSRYSIDLTTSDLRRAVLTAPKSLNVKRRPFLAVLEDLGLRLNHENAWFHDGVGIDEETLPLAPLEEDAALTIHKEAFTARFTRERHKKRRSDVILGVGLQSVLLGDFVWRVDEVRIGKRKVKPWATCLQHPFHRFHIKRAAKKDITVKISGTARWLGLETFAWDHPKKGQINECGPYTLELVPGKILVRATAPLHKRLIDSSLTTAGVRMTFAKGMFPPMRVTEETSIVKVVEPYPVSRSGRREWCGCPKDSVRRSKPTWPTATTHEVSAPWDEKGVESLTLKMFVPVEEPITLEVVVPAR